MIIAFGTLMENLLIDVSEDTVICGSDEAGRGPLAGPVVAAAVILPHDFPIGLLGDSKKMSEKRRLEAEAVIKEKAIAWATAAVSHKVIDRINILNASLLAMSRAYMKASRIAHADMLLVDGNRTPSADIPCRAIVKGDAKVPEIMAASILAKNERDRLMALADRKWPQYGYAKHKGYPTAGHIESIRINGPSPIQRLTFHTGLERDEEPDLFSSPGL